MSYRTIKAKLYVNVSIDEDILSDLIDEVAKAKELAGGELPTDHEWYGIDTEDDAVKFLASGLIADDEYSVHDWELL